jgi:O-antigen ligase
MFNRKNSLSVPFLVWVVIGTTLMACVGGWTFAGYNASGYAWLITSVFSFFILLYNLKDITFPLFLWLPWIIYVTASFILTRAPNGLQRSFMLLCPILVGLTVSSYSVAESQLRHFSRLIRWLALLLLAFIVLKSGLLLTGKLPDFGVSATIAITGSLLASFFAASYVSRAKNSLMYWLLIQVMSVIALVRMPMLATGITLPLTLGPMSYKKRIWASVAVIVGGLILFYTPRMQERMFYSGEGTLSDLTLESGDLKDTGRTFIWDIMNQEITRRPWLGHGSNASEDLVLSITGYSLTHPHNDWLRLEYDYGYVGMGVFLLCMLAQIIHAFLKARKSIGETRILFYAGASAFIPFALIMFTDNIILYAAFFGNLQFAMLGLAYAARRTHERDARHSYYSSTASEFRNPIYTADKSNQIHRPSTSEVEAIVPPPPRCQ